MIMKAKYLYIISMLALGFVACQQGGEEQLLPSNGEMQFNIATTRVANGAFEAEDKVGLYVTDYADATTPAPLQISGNRANNEALLFDGSKWQTERPIYWGEGKSDIYAYYPMQDYIKDVDREPFSVAIDQDVDGAYEASDFLWAKVAGAQQSEGRVSLELKHQMSRLVVKIMAGEDYEGALPSDATVHLLSTVPNAFISFDNGSVIKDPYGGVHSIKMHNIGIRSFADGDAVVYEAIVVPQMLEKPVPLLEINSKSVSYLLEDIFSFKPGMSYTYTAVLNVSTSSIKVEIGCEIEDWNNIGGDSYGEDLDSGGGSVGGVDLSSYTDLSAEGTANCYPIQVAGKYKFKAVQGNTDIAVGNVKKVDVLWESFGNEIVPNTGDLITNVGYKNGYVYFSTPATFKNGNASIAVRNSKDLILWSWHIWCTEEGWKDQVYDNNPNAMMDRNLGATSANPGDIGAFGLLYQWGRKDPLLGGYLYDYSDLVASTGVWSLEKAMTAYFAEENPMTFCQSWRGTEDRWIRYSKSLHDPCPVGYRVPSAEYWSRPLREKAIEEVIVWDKHGIFWKLGNGDVAWYPAVGYRDSYTGDLCEFDTSGHYYSSYLSSGTTKKAYGLYFNLDNMLETGISELKVPSSGNSGRGCSVRCIKE